MRLPLEPRVFFSQSRLILLSAFGEFRFSNMSKLANADPFMVRESGNPNTLCRLMHPANHVLSDASPSDPAPAATWGTPTFASSGV